ncbi:MAG: hypothetical protein SGJ18_12140 [Pseudomonadota bacterium]|nr:hypothetical protein [Pseudomonadota bacterium]
MCNSKTTAICLTFIFQLYVSVSAAERSVEYMFPEIENRSAAGGRGYSQPLALERHHAHVLPGASFGVTIGQTSDNNGLSGYNPQGAPKTNLSTDTYTLRVAFGTEIKGTKVEFGGNASKYLDMRSNYISRGADAVHRMFKVKGFIPDKNAPVGAYIGGQKVDDISHSFGGYVKIQALEQNIEDGLVSRPDLAVTFSVNASSKFGDAFVQPGAGVTVAAQKRVLPWLTVLAAAAVSCQKNNASRFESKDVRARMCNSDYFIGAVGDPGKDGGFYVTGGLSFNENRVVDQRDTKRTNFSPVLNLSLRFMDEERIYDCGLNATEGLEKRPVSRHDDFSLTADCKVLNFEKAAKGIQSLFSSK